MVTSPIQLADVPQVRRLIAVVAVVAVVGVVPILRGCQPDARGRPPGGVRPRRYPLDSEIPDYSREQFEADLVDQCERDIRQAFATGAK